MSGAIIGVGVLLIILGLLLAVLALATGGGIMSERDRQAAWLGVAMVTVGFALVAGGV